MGKDVADGRASLAAPARTSEVAIGETIVAQSVTNIDGCYRCEIISMRRCETMTCLVDCSWCCFCLLLVSQFLCDQVKPMVVSMASLGIASVLDFETCA